MKKNEMGGACGRYGGQRGAYRIFGEVTRGKKKPSEDSGVDGTMEIKWIFKKWNGEQWTGLMWF